MFDYDSTDDRLTLRRPGTRWLSNAVDGGYRTADAAHNLTVPEGFDRTDLAGYADERLGERASGPTLLTGVSQAHARGARRGPVEAVATVGLSNPAVLPVDTEATSDRATSDRANPDRAVETGRFAAETEPDWRPGTVNVLLGTTRQLDDGGLAGLLATAVEAKAATLLDAADVPGTTSDAVVVGCAPDGDRSAFAGSATAVGAATRVCVRDAILASLDARYADGPPTPENAEHGVVTDGRTSVFDPDDSNL